VNPTDALFDTVSKILEIFQDNLTTRLKLNEYSHTLLLQLNDMLHENINKEITTKKVADNKKSKVKEAAVNSLKVKFSLENISHNKYSKSIILTNNGHQCLNKALTLWVLIFQKIKTCPQPLQLAEDILLMKLLQTTDCDLLHLIIPIHNSNLSMYVNFLLYIFLLFFYFLILLTKNY